MLSGHDVVVGAQSGRQLILVDAGRRVRNGGGVDESGGRRWFGQNTGG